MGVTSGPYDDPRDPDQLPAIELSKVMQALPGVARIAVSSWWHTAQWSAATGWRLTRQLGLSARDPEIAAELAHELGVSMSVVLELGRQVSEGVPLPKALLSASRPFAEWNGSTAAGASDHGDDGDDGQAQLRARGEELLHRSRDVRDNDLGHPAYGRILDELAPDEARILLLLARSGAQPAVDVRTGGPVGMVNSRLLVGGLTMIGPRAGCRHLDYVPSYLNNLFRLGLVWFSRETLREPGPYQVLEAQPDVLEAMHSVKMAKVVRRSIKMTPFGEDFCRIVLVPDADQPAAQHGQAAADDAGGPELG